MSGISSILSNLATNLAAGGPSSGFKYATLKIHLRAKIGGVDYKSVVGVAVNDFGVNQIPVATLILPIGRNLQTDQIAQIHKTFDQIAAQQVMLVWVTATWGDVENAVPGLPNGEEVLIFDGRVTGTAWRYADNQDAQVLVTARHWLCAIDQSSAISASSFPGNPLAWTYPVIAQQLGGTTTATTGLTPQYIPGGQPVSPADLRDMWLNVFYKRMRAVILDDPCVAALRSEDDGSRLQALTRMAQQVDGVPLALQTAGNDAQVIASAIETWLNTDTGDHWAHTTLWGKLVGEWASSFMFSVIPRITDALVVPFTGGLQGAPWITITAADYTRHELSGAMPKLLRALGIVRPATATTGINQFLGPRTEELGGVGGFFQVPGVRSGVIMLKDAPAWLGAGNAARLFTGAATGVGTGTTINTAIGGQPFTQAQLVAAAVAIIGAGAGGVFGALGSLAGLPPVIDFDRILDKLAHQWFVIEMLRARVGELEGKLRFDIAPGSNIELDIAQSKNIPPELNTLNKKVFATVTSLWYVIDAEKQRASTGFSLAHIRNPVENAAPGTSVEGPPLYEKTWRGASLLQSQDAADAAAANAAVAVPIVGDDLTPPPDGPRFA